MNHQHRWRLYGEILTAIPTSGRWLRLTRKSRREIETALDNLDTDDKRSVRAFLWADLKNVYGGPLTPGEQAVLSDPERYLSAEARAKLDL